jgi:hypothetical protein
VIRICWPFATWLNYRRHSLSLSHDQKSEKLFDSPLLLTIKSNIKKNSFALPHYSAFFFVLSVKVERERVHIISRVCLNSVQQTQHSDAPISGQSWLVSCVLFVLLLVPFRLHRRLRPSNILLLLFGCFG